MKPLTVFLPVLLLLSSCNRFYAPVKAWGVPSDAVKKYYKEGKTFILHDSSFTYLMANMTLENDVIKTLLFQRESLKSKYHSSQSHLNFYYSSRGSKDTSVVNQIHLFTNRPLTSGENVTVSIPLSEIMDVQELKFDNKETNQRRTKGVLLGAIAIIVVATLVSLNAIGNMF